MKINEQENTKKVPQENIENGREKPIFFSDEILEPSQSTQLFLPKEAMDNIAEIERQYIELVERENI